MSALRRKTQTLRDRYNAWMALHPALTGIIVAGSIAAGICLIFGFTIFSGLGSSADFVYNQF